jgi:hypothetical protein
MKQHHEQSKAFDGMMANIGLGIQMGDQLHAQGRYQVQCFEHEGGELLWEDNIENVVMTVGKNLALDTILAGSAYTVVGPYMGLISSVGYTSVPVAADTMASHATWVEAGNSTNYPLLTARVAPSWSAASAGSKATSAAVSFTIGATGGTLKGAFLVFGTGAVTTLASTAGTLLSAGLFTGGDQVVSTGNVVTVTYSLGL